MRRESIKLARNEQRGDIYWISHVNIYSTYTCYFAYSLHIHIYIYTYICARAI